MASLEYGSTPSMGLPSAESNRRSSLSQTLPSSVYRNHYRQQSLPSLSQAMHASLTASHAVTATLQDASWWRQTVHEVKQKYLACRYRSCSAQCCEVLDNLKDTSTVEPLHLVYLHFYAASSFEWCARPLCSSSTYRTKLLRSAQEHYAEAEALIVATEWNMTERARSPSSVSVTSLSSPGLSAGSGTSGSNSSASSPRTSVFSLEDEPLARRSRQAHVKPKKKVSFSGLPEFFEFQPEPYVRPDSPTLGWEDHIFVSPHRMDGPYPTSPNKPSPVSILKVSQEERMSRTSIMTGLDFNFPVRDSARVVTPATPEPTDKNTTASQEQNQGRSCTPTNHTFDLESFLHARSFNRFRDQLSALKDQVNRHRVVVDDLLATPDSTPIATPSDETYTFPETQPPYSTRTKSPPPGPRRHPSIDLVSKLEPSLAQRTNSSSRPALRLQTDTRRDAPSAYNHLRSYSSASVSFCQAYDSPLSSPTSIILRPLTAGGDEGGLQDRIERLRANGWQRRRFNSRRYEALREQVLGELGPCR